MGCGQSLDSAYSNRRIMPAKTPQQNWAQNVAVPGLQPINKENQTVLDRKILEEYLKIERAIAEAQREDPEVISRLKTQVAALETAQKQLTELDENPQKYSKRDREEAMNQRDEAQTQVVQLRKKAEKIETLHTRQDDLLAQMFGGGYGSDREVQLEQHLNMLELRRGHIMEANFKWRQAQMMLEYACRQLAVAVQKWQDLPDIPTIELEIRYTMAAESRNGLMTSNQNGDQTTLNSAPVPYNGGQGTYSAFAADTDDDPETAKSKLQNNHDKASTLLNWFEQVLNTTIMQDLAVVNRQLRETALALRDERVRLIKQKVHEIWGEDVHIEIEEEVVDQDGEAAVLQDLDLEAAIPDQEMMNYLEQLSPADLKELEMGRGITGADIFGKSYEEFKQELNNMREQHEMEMGQFLRDQDRQAAKTRGDLQAKLEARRRYRAMKNLEDKQRQDLNTGAVVT